MAPENVKQKTQGKEKWAPVFNKAPSPVSVAEPQHRVGAHGISSGVSLRTYPRNYIQQVLLLQTILSDFMPI